MRVRWFVGDLSFCGVVVMWDILLVMISVSAENASAHERRAVLG